MQVTKANSARYFVIRDENVIKCYQRYRINVSLRSNQLECSSSDSTPLRRANKTRADSYYKELA